MKPFFCAANDDTSQGDTPIFFRLLMDRLGVRKGAQLEWCGWLDDGLRGLSRVVDVFGRELVVEPFELEALTPAARRVLDECYVPSWHPGACGAA